MPGLPLWPDDHGQVIGQKSFSTGHRRSPMIDRSDSKSLLPHGLEAVESLEVCCLIYLAISQALPSYPDPRLPKIMSTVYGVAPIHQLQPVLPTSERPSAYKTHSVHPAGGLAQ